MWKVPCSSWHGGRRSAVLPGGGRVRPSAYVLPASNSMSSDCTSRSCISIQQWRRRGVRGPSSPRRKEQKYVHICRRIDGLWLMQRQISSPRSYAQPFLRTNASKANRDEPRAVRPRAWRNDKDFLAEIESGSMGLDERLESMGIDPKEYRTYETLDSSKGKYNRC